MIICVLKQNNRLGPNFAAINRPLIKGLKHLMCPKTLNMSIYNRFEYKKRFYQLSKLTPTPLPPSQM